jgi:murein DD-endopeptidase MepM/ murein hydrolase activator NlpD
MEINQVKIVVIAAAILSIACLSAQAQFNTIYLKHKLQELAAEKIMEETAGAHAEETKQIQGTKSINLDEKEQYVLNGMNRRQNLALPIDELTVTSPYGYRNDPFTGKRKFHKGIDLDADFHYVYSVMPGKVLKSGKNRELGEFVQVEHGEFVTTYGHLFQRLVEAKQFVEAGQSIGVSGSTGRSTGEHLHFGMSFNGKSIDPMPILNYIQQVLHEAKKEIEHAIRELTIEK